MKVAPLSEKVAVYDVVTGAMLLRWPVDARGLVASGEFLMTPPVVSEVDGVPVAVDESVVDAAEPEAAHTSRVKRR